MKPGQCFRDLEGGNSLLFIKEADGIAYLTFSAKVTGEPIDPKEGNFILRGPKENLAGLLDKFTAETRENVLENAKLLYAKLKDSDFAE